MKLGRRLFTSHEGATRASVSEGEAEQKLVWIRFEEPGFVYEAEFYDW